MIYEVTIYKNYNFNIVKHIIKNFSIKEKAYNYFEEAIREELNTEIEKGLISNQELQNILNNKQYKYCSKYEEILIQLQKT